MRDIKFWILILFLDPWALILDHDRLRVGRKRKKKRRRRIVPRSHQWPIKQFDDHERSQSLHIHREVILVLCGNHKLKRFSNCSALVGLLTVRGWERMLNRGSTYLQENLQSPWWLWIQWTSFGHCTSNVQLANRLVILRRPDILKRPGL